jgi:hypothetical protein
MDRLELSNGNVLLAKTSCKSDCFEHPAVQKAIEIGLSLLVATVCVAILVRRRSSNTEKLLARVAMGVGVGFWLHRDLVYLLLH